MALPEKACVVEKTGADEVQVRVGEKQVHIIGWVHLAQQDIDVLRDGFNTAIQALEKKECFMVKNALASALTKKNLDLRSAQEVFKKLEKVHSQKPLTYIGLESTPAEYSENLTAMRSIAEGLRAMQITCGMMLAPEVSSFALMMPGPEYAFNGAYEGGVVLKALEDENSKQANQRQIASGKNKKQAFMGLQERNKAMVRHILEQEGNGAIVVGKLHVADMANELIRQCHSAK